MITDADDRLWNALVDRDPSRADVVYAVVTTGIYCRIGCASRRPRRRNTVFFDDGHDAERHGFRACLRCLPDRDSRPQDVLAARVRAVCARLDDSLEQRSVTDIAADIGCSARQLDRTFRALTGVGIAAYRRELSRRRGREALRHSHDVTTAMWASGYRSSHNFYEQVVPTLGMSARRYRDRGEGRTVRFTIIDHGIGSILIAATDDGVCAIRVGADRSALETELREEFGLATVNRDDDRLEAVARLVEELADGRRPHGDLPLDIEGTAFQVQVWEQLRRLRRGESITYAELARRCGRPAAQRAVGSAVGANPVALAIPCHRVVRSDGGLGGYRWGTEVKQALLDAEQTPAAETEGR